MQANSILAKHLVLTDFENLCTNPSGDVGDTNGQIPAGWIGRPGIGEQHPARHDEPRASRPGRTCSRRATATPTSASGSRSRRRSILVLGRRQAGHDGNDRAGPGSRSGSNSRTTPRGRTPRGRHRVHRRRQDGERLAVALGLRSRSAEQRLASTLASGRTDQRDRGRDRPVVVPERERPPQERRQPRRRRRSRPRIHGQVNFAGTTAGLTSYNATTKQSPNIVLVLSRSINGGAFSDVATYTPSSSHSETAPIPASSDPGIYEQFSNGSWTYTDSAHLAQNREFKVRITTFSSINSTVDQNTIAVQSIE
jgi:hypothetical protein